MRCISMYVHTVHIFKIHTPTHSLAAQEEEVQPQPGEDQHDDGDGEAEDKPCAEIDHLSIWIPTEETKREAELHRLQWNGNIGGRMF